MDPAICTYCDAVHRRAPVPGRATARCVACDAPPYRANKDVVAMLAITLVMVFAMGSLGSFDHATLWDRVAKVKPEVMR